MQACLKTNRCADERPSSDDLPVTAPVRRLMKGAFSLAALDHPAMEVLHSLGAQRRTRLLREKDTDVRIEASAFMTRQSMQEEAATAPPSKGPSIAPPDPEVVNPPPVYARLVGAMADPASLAESTIQAIQADQEISSFLLDILSRRLFGPDRPVRSVREACVFLTAKRLCHVACTLSLLLDATPSPGVRLDHQPFLRHSLATGVMAGILAAKAGLKRSDDFFVAGLAHDLGRLILERNRPKELAAARKHARSTSIALNEAESAVLGYSHPTQASALLRSWPLSPPLTSAILYHHIPELAPSVPESSVIHLADIMSHALCFGASGETRVPPLSEEGWDSLGLVPSILERVADEAQTVLGTPPQVGECPDKKAFRKDDSPFDFF